MTKDNINKIYSSAHYSFFDKIILNKRLVILDVVKNFLKDKNIQDVLDIGSTGDDNNISSNFIIKNLGEYKTYKSISDQDIGLNFFSNKLKKSITENFSEEDIVSFKSDLVISNATIEHVGSFENQTKMCDNILKMTKKYFVIITPNRFHPIEFHTKIPFIHWLPKKMHRSILIFLGLKFFADENNLNLLSQNDLKLIMKKLNQTNYDIKKINFLYFKSNLILIGKKN
jgi:hypothetical protein